MCGKVIPVAAFHRNGRDEINPKFLRMISQVALDAQPHLASEESGASQDNRRRLAPTPAESPPRVALNSADRELLIQRVLETVRSGRPAIQMRSQEMEAELMLCSTRPAGLVKEEEASTPGISLVGKVVPPPTMPGGRDSCFSCGQQGHGVTRCSRMDVSFPFLLHGWLIDMLNGRYRASQIRGDGRNYTPGKVGWSGREGQLPGSSETVVQLTPGGGGGERRVLGGRQPVWQQPVGCVRE